MQTELIESTMLENDFVIADDRTEMTDATYANNY
jgi:hypothetical protein